MTKHACPFAENCRTREFLKGFYETVTPWPCLECFNTCHVFEEKMTAYREAKSAPKESQSLVPALSG
jgi:hypothetical protein